MKQSLQALVKKMTDAEKAIAATTDTSNRASRMVTSAEQELSRLQREMYHRVWTGETTGDKIDDIVIATKGSYNAQVAGKLRALMEKFAKHQGQFVAGRHRNNISSCDQVLVGIVDTNELLFCRRPKESYTQPYIELPIKPAVFYDSGWQWGFKNLGKSEWRIFIDKEESLTRQRCWGLERLIEVDMKNPSIHIGDESVWEFVQKTGQHKFGSLVTFAHIASALGRPLLTVPAFTDRTAPFVADIEGLVPSFVKARTALTEVETSFKKVREQPFVKDVMEETESALHDIKESIGAMEQFLKYVKRPHRIKTRA